MWAYVIQGNSAINSREKKKCSKKLLADYHKSVGKLNDFKKIPRNKKIHNNFFC